MANADEKHFESYREQTKLKHQILVEYLPAYYNVLMGNNKNLVYVDGFAGRGYYLEGNESRPGSPILAMRLFAASTNHREQVKCYFIEKEATYAKELGEAVKTQQFESPLAKEPVLYHGTFAEFVAQLRTHLAKENSGLAPTFLFVDPCGVDGVKMDDLAEVLARDGCELFLFFNYDGISRIAGNAERVGSSPTLVALFGTEGRVQHLIQLLKLAQFPRQREEIILSEFCRALKESAKADFQLPFRIEHEQKAQTSHYLLHATKHHLGFKIMKWVMEKATRSGGGGDGRGFELLQASNSGEASLFVSPSIASMQLAILDELRKGPQLVSVFRNDWVIRPTDMFSDDQYKRVLLDLEREGQILVYDTDNLHPRPADKRLRKNPKTGGREATLGESNWLRIA